MESSARDPRNRKEREWEDGSRKRTNGIWKMKGRREKQRGEGRNQKRGKQVIMRG